MCGHAYNPTQLCNYVHHGLNCGRLFPRRHRAVMVVIGVRRPMIFRRCAVIPSGGRWHLEDGKACAARSVCRCMRRACLPCEAHACAAARGEERGGEQGTWWLARSVATRHHVRATLPQRMAAVGRAWPGLRADVPCRHIGLPLHGRMSQEQWRGEERRGLLVCGGRCENLRGGSGYRVDFLHNFLVSKGCDGGL
jgi:hypothetical protein